MGEFTGKRSAVRIEGTRYTIADLARILDCTPHAARRRYLHRKARGMELSLRALAKPLTGTTKKLTNPRKLSPFLVRLRQHLTQQGRRNQDLAKRLGILQSSVSRMLCERRAITPERLGQICDWLMLTDEEEHELNVLAARDHGWKV